MGTKKFFFTKMEVVIPASTENHDTVPVPETQVETQVEAQVEAQEQKVEGMFKCFNCKEFGHKMAECPAPKVERQNFNPMLAGKCFNCQGFGHWSKDCPSQNRAVRQNG